MRYLVISKDYECRDFDILMAATDQQISEFTTKKNSSKEIRDSFKQQVLEFINRHNDNGDIVIIDDNHKRIKVLYKKDIIVFKSIILNQKFMISTLNSYKYYDKSMLYKIYSEADKIDIRSFKGKSYERYIRSSFKSKIKKSDYYDIVREVIKLYNIYIKDHPNLPTPNDIYMNYLNNKKINLQNIKSDITNYEDKYKNINTNTNLEVSEALNENEKFYMEVFNAFQNGGLEEVFMYYSLDELYEKLNESELESIELSKKIK